MKQETIFIADLHLSAHTKALNQLFFDFLDTLEANALYILGDLFEYWIGDDDQSEFHQQMVNALKKTSTKIPVYFMPGNRDFLISKKWTRRAGLHFLKDPAVIKLYEHRVLLSHGDLFCTNDKTHQWFRLITQNPFFQHLFLAMPYLFRKKLAEKVREKSVIKNKSAKKISPIMDVQWDAVEQMLIKNKTDYLIHGHTHKPNIHYKKNYLRAVLPSWDHHPGSYLTVFLNQKNDIQFELCDIKND
jgi:UDP-2,3-diacylglucosamine hydrolase